MTNRKIFSADMTENDWHDYFAENMPTIWPGLSAQSKALAVASALLGFEMGMNQMEYNVKVGGCL